MPFTLSIILCMNASTCTISHSTHAVNASVTILSQGPKIPATVYKFLNSIFDYFLYWTQILSLYTITKKKHRRSTFYFIMIACLLCETHSTAMVIGHMGAKCRESFALHIKHLYTQTSCSMVLIGHIGNG